MEQVFLSIRYIVCSMPGIFSYRIRLTAMDESLTDIYNKVYKVHGMSTPMDDRINLKNDIHYIKKDFKKAVKEYKIQHQPSAV